MANPQELLDHPLNWRTHTDEQRAALNGAMDQVGWVRDILVNKRTGRIIDGHLRADMARKQGLTEVPVLYVDLDEDEEALVLASLDPLSAMAGQDDEKLRELLESLNIEDPALQAMFDRMLAEETEQEQGAGAGGGGSSGSLSDRFVIPPFSVLNARDGWWQDRKADWIARGIRSELGRDEKLIYSDSAQPPGVYQLKNEYEAKVGRKVSWEEFHRENPEASAHDGTSIFDPVLCELIYRWFCPPTGHVLDPFAGGSVRGIVAAMLGRHYTGDAADIERLAKGTKADLLFSCPPYADLERYSDDPRDLSTMDYPAFLDAYRRIIAAAAGMLRKDRFACFVVGDIRDPKGIYRNFVSDTIAAFRDAGLQLYNEAILVTAVGSLAIRVGRQFAATRKLGKTHQQVLVFVKGDARKATEACGPVEVPDEALAAEEQVGEVVA